MIEQIGYFCKHMVDFCRPIASNICKCMYVQILYVTANTHRSWKRIVILVTVIVAAVVLHNDHIDM